MTSVVKNTETIGLWIEYLVCKINKIPFNTSQNRMYVQDLKFEIEETVLSELKKIFGYLAVKEHCGGMNKDYDFLLENGEKLSVKSSISNDKICPATIGQTSLSKLGFSSNEEYKKFVITNPLKTLEMYYKYLSSDHNIYVNFHNGYIAYWKKTGYMPFRNLGEITFTQTLASWNESSTLKINGKSVAEFQVHNNRNCIKCRFSMNGMFCIIDHERFVIPKYKFNVYKDPGNPGTFNYLGSKTKLLDFLVKNIEGYTQKKICDITSFYDLFAGTGVVSNHFASLGCKNIAVNDLMYYGYILSSSISSRNINSDKIKSSIATMNLLPGSSGDGYITRVYASNGRMYFTKENAQKIDAMRDYLETNREMYTEEEHNLLLKILLYACSKVSNISSTYGAFLKKFKKSSMAQIHLQNITVHDNVNVLKSNKSVLELEEMEGELCYLDPPYNSRRYSTNYFVIESIAKNNKPEVSQGITGIPVDTQNDGDFCSKRTCSASFRKIFSLIKTDYLVMSYNSESLLSKEEVVSLLEESGRNNIVVYEEEYKRFKSNKNGSQPSVVIEYLFCCRT